MYVIGQTPGICDDRSILSYLPILVYKCIKHSKILDCLELLRTEEMELEGNVLRYLRPTKSQMLMGKNFQMFFVMSKYPSYPNIHGVQDVQMSMMSKCP